MPDLLRLLHGQAGMHRRRLRCVVVLGPHHHCGVIVGELGGAGRQAGLNPSGTAALLGGRKGGDLVLHLY